MRSEWYTGRANSSPADKSWATARLLPLLQLFAAECCRLVFPAAALRCRGSGHRTYPIRLAELSSEFSWRRRLHPRQGSVVERNRRDHEFDFESQNAIRN